MNRPNSATGCWRSGRARRSCSAPGASSARRARSCWSGTRVTPLARATCPLPWGPSHEEIYVIGKGFMGHRDGSVLRVQAYSSGDADRPDHPTPKPPALMVKLLEKCPPEWVICDPFMGSGATLVAAKQLGRRCIGIEISDEYCEMARWRCGQEVLGL